MDLDTIEARLNAATPGPWHLNQIGDVCHWNGEYERYIADMHNDADAALVVHAPADLAALIAEVRRGRRACASETKVKDA